MGDLNHEPSMEEILASIKRIIAEDGDTAVQTAERRRPRARTLGRPLADVTDTEAEEPMAPVLEAVPDPDVMDYPQQREEVLELTDKLDVAEAAPTATSEAPSIGKASIVSDEAANASRSALSALSALIVKPQPLADNTLEGLVREMLRPILKEWLDANLPELVEAMVAKEIARITGKTF